MVGIADRSEVRHRPGGVRLWVVVAAGLVAVALLVWLVAVSSVFGVRTVTVSGTNLLSRDQVLQAADVKHGQPLLRLDSGAIKRRVLALPEVAQVSVHSSFPSKVQIVITERAIVGYRVMASGFELVDGTNREFRAVASAPSGVPQLGTGSTEVATAIAYVAAQLPSTLASKLAGITATGTETITLNLADGRTVLWGGTDRSADKAKLVLAILSRPGVFFDVSDPDTVIARMTK